MTATAAQAETTAPSAAPVQDAQTLLGQQASEAKEPEASAKPADAKPEQAADQGKPAEKAGAPEKYEFKAPEGQSFDEKVIATYSEVARELNLSQDAAQKVLDRVAPVMQARQVEQFQEMQDRTFSAWADETKADKEIGGQRLPENLRLAAKAVDRFGGKALRALLDESGFGNRREVIAAFAAIGRAISDDSFVAGEKTQSDGPVTMAELVRQADRAAGLR